jgi:hypothetical protein
MENPDDLLAEIRELGKEPDFYGPSSEVSISDAQQLLGVSFPPSYLDFLRRFGGGYGFIGISNSDASLMSGGCILGETVRFREKFGLTNEYVPIRESPLGGIYCLDSSKIDFKNENPVVLISFGPDGTFSHNLRVAKSFGEFFTSILKDRLEVLLDEVEE